MRRATAKGGRMRTIAWRAATAVGACVALGLGGAGCAGGGKRPALGGGAVQERRVETKRPRSAAALDAVGASLLRERAIVTIEEASRSPDARVRGNAVEAAGFGPARLHTVIRAGLMDENVGVRSIAGMAVGRWRLSELAEGARPLTQDESGFGRTSGIYALAMCGEEVDRSPIGMYLLNDPDARVRAHCAYLLGEMGDASALPMLREAVKRRPGRSTPSEVTLFALQVCEAMVKLGDDRQLEPLRAALYPSRPEELEGTALAVQILGQVGDRGAIDQLVYLSAAKDKAGNMMPAEVRLAVAGSLAKLGLPKGDFIADEFAGSPNPALRSQAAYVYGETRTPTNLGILRGMLDDAEPGVRVAAAASILKITGR